MDMHGQDAPSTLEWLLINLVFPTVGMAFAAFCVWLAVRIICRRERWTRRVAFAILGSLPVLYALSWGPSIWLVHRASYPDWVIQRILWFYLPMGWLHENVPGPIGETVRWWARIWQ